MDPCFDHGDGETCLQTDLLDRRALYKPRYKELMITSTAVLEKTIHLMDHLVGRTVTLGINFTVIGAMMLKTQDVFLAQESSIGPVPQSRRVNDNP